MSLPRFLLLLAVIVVLFMATAAFGAYWVLVRPGTVIVDIVENGIEQETLSLRVPAGLVNLGIGACPLVMREQSADLEEWKPVISTLLRDLERYPDVPLLRVSEDGNTVVIEKRHGTLRIEIHDEEADVRIELPAGTTREMLRALDDL